LLLAVVVVVGGGLRGYRAAHPSERQSTDELAYMRLALAVADGERYGDAGTGLSDPFHWAPGAPVGLGVVARLDPSPRGRRSEHVPIAYWAQAAFGTLLIVVVFAIAATLAGGPAGAVAAAIVSFYPPLVRASGEFLSEPLGALLLALAVLVALHCWRRSPPWLLLPGALFGAATLTRADLLPAPLLVALVVALALRKRSGRASAAGAAAALACGTLLVVVPWVVYASQRVGRPVPVSTADGGPLFVGTFLPGDGTTAGATRALAGEVRRLHPSLRNAPVSKLTGTQALEAVARRHPGEAPSLALRMEGLRNLSRYGLRRPAAFAWMMASKVWSMWSRPSAPGSWRASPATKIAHVAIVLLCLAGLAAGLLLRRRDLRLAVILAVLVSGVLVHSVFVAGPRYALPLFPLLVAGGVAGGARALDRGLTTLRPSGNRGRQV
jgi:4-amino-4-deoxy-L-arabinose transferase-like glycosyltransferase